MLMSKLTVKAGSDSKKPVRDVHHNLLGLRIQRYYEIFVERNRMELTL